MQQTFKLTAIASLVIAAPALADNANNQLDTVEVTANSGSTLSENKKTFTASAMKTTTGLTLSPKETPQSVSVITKAQLNDRAITTMEEALKTTTGVNVIREGSRVRFQSRGFYMERIEEDGISSMTPGSLLNPNSDPQSMTDLAIYDHIEVVRGATGLTQGNGQPGGTINAVRKKPTSETQANLNLGINQYGGVRATTDLSGSLNDSQSVRGRLVTVGEKTQSFKNGVDGSNRLVYGVMDMDLGDSAILTLGALYQNQHQTPDVGGLPMGDDGRDLGLPVDTFLGANWNKTIARKYNVFAELDYFFNDNWHWNNKVSYTNSRYNQQSSTISNSTNVGVTSAGTLASDSRLSRFDNKGHQFAYQSNLTGKYSLFGREHDLFTTYTYSVENLHARWRQFNADGSSTRSYTLPNVNVYQFAGGIRNPDFNVGPYRFLENEDYTLTSHGVSFGTRFNILDNLHLLVGSRYTHWDSDYRDIYQSSVSEFTSAATVDPNPKKRSRFVPYAGLTYDITPTQSVYYSYTQIFRPQLSAKDINGKSLDPVLGTNNEIGWKADWYGDNSLNTAVALFQIDETNRPVTIPAALSSTSRAYQVPMGKVRSRGVDAEISGRVTDNWNLFAGYTFNMSEYKRNESGRILEGANFSLHTPKHMFRLYTNYRFDKLTVGGGVSAQSKTNSLNSVAQGGYAVWNANIQYAINKNVTMSLNAENLFNRRYYENHRSRAKGINNYYGAPRHFTLNFDWKL